MAVRYVNNPNHVTGNAGGANVGGGAQAKERPVGNEEHFEEDELRHAEFLLHWVHTNNRLPQVM